MKNKRKFYRVVFQCEVLIDSEDTFESMANGFWRMDEVANKITKVDCSGNFYVKSAQEVTPKQMVKLLQNQGSDPGFFSLYEDGNDIEN